MTKTRVDDILIEMITPKIKEIEEKFSSGQGLTQDDINTLLLKSQYNHINHLDDKLNEVTASVVALEGKFQGLDGKFQTFKAEMTAEFEKRIGGLETKVEKRIGDLETNFEKRMGGLETKFSSLETKFEQAQVKMQQTILTTIKWYIGGTGVVLVLVKALEVFTK